MNLRKLFRQKFGSKADLPKPLPAVVGDGAGNVRVNGRDNYVYVRIGQSLAEAYCDTDVRHGESVLVGYDPVNPRLFRVLMNGGGGGEVGEIITSDRYRWAAPGGGQDPLMVELRQFLPARLGPAGGLKVSVYPGVAWCGTAWKLVGGSTHDLSTMVPATSGKARMVLFCIDDNGNITTTAGSEVDISSLSINDLPLPPSGSVYAIGAVRLYAGQTVIREARTNTDIVDLRFPLSVVRGGGDMLKAIYDTDNDGVVDAAQSVDWDGVQNKPSTYPPDSHTHDDRYYTETELNTSGAGGQVHWNNVTNKPSTYPPSTHSHSASDITSGTLSTDRFSAYADLVAENKIGTGSGQVAAGNHGHLFALGVFVIQTSSLSIPTATPTDLSWDYEFYDDANFWSAAYPTRFYAPKTGYYFVNAGWSFTPTITGFRQAIQIVDSSGAVLYNHVHTPAVANRSSYVSLSSMVKINQGNYIRIQVYQDTGSTISSSAANTSNPYICFCTVTYLGIP